MNLKRDWREIWLWTLGKRWRFSIAGNSMLPTLKPGEDVLVEPINPTLGVTPGDIVVCRHPFTPTLRLVKRVSETFCDGGCYVLSDNLVEGTDSRSFGVVDKRLLLGRVTSRFF